MTRRILIKLASSLFLCTGVISLTSCVNTALENDIRRVQSNVTDLRSFQAEQTTKISSLETELRQISGRLEELELARNRKLGTDLSNLPQDLSDLKPRVPPPPIVPAAMLEND